MTKIDAIKEGLTSAPFFALSPQMIATLREQQPERTAKPEIGPKAA